MTIREEMEKRELNYLSPYAAFSIHSKGREKKEPECDIRPVYQRDRDRILHSKAFRRLKQKTQVFLLPNGDHYRTRLTHTLEVSQIARTMGKALRLNEDLTEAIALGHDLGHTPFGHAGEKAINSIYHFSHHEQSVRVVEHLEREGAGLNLTWEVRNGILNHKTSGSPSTLEGQIVRLSDKIAYIHHDMDDAVRGGVLTETDIPKEIRNTLGNTGKQRLNTLVHDVIRTSMNQPQISMSPEIGQAMAELRKYMFQNVYLNPKVKGEEDKAEAMVIRLFQYFTENPDELPEHFRQNLTKTKTKKEQIVCDYIAGMTDNYAIEKYLKLFVPKEWKN